MNPPANSLARRRNCCRRTRKNIGAQRIISALHPPCSTESRSRLLLDAAMGGHERHTAGIDEVPLAARNYVLRAGAGIHTDNGPIEKIHALFVNRLRITHDELAIQTQSDAYRSDQILAFRE